MWYAQKLLIYENSPNSYRELVIEHGFYLIWEELSLIVLLDVLYIYFRGLRIRRRYIPKLRALVSEDNPNLQFQSGFRCHTHTGVEYLLKRTLIGLQTYFVND